MPQEQGSWLVSVISIPVPNPPRFINIWVHSNQKKSPSLQKTAATVESPRKACKTLDTYYLREYGTTNLKSIIPAIKSWYWSARMKRTHSTCTLTQTNMLMGLDSVIDSFKELFLRPWKFAQRRSFHLVAGVYSSTYVWVRCPATSKRDLRD